VLKAARECHAQVIAVDSSSFTLNGLYPKADIKRWAACLTRKVQRPNTDIFAIGVG
jgi:hypothetical protein